MSTVLPELPAVFRNLEGKIHPDVAHAIKLLFYGLQDNKQAIVALSGKHNTLQTQVTGVSATASSASTAAATANAAVAQPVAAGQTNIQSGTLTPYVTTQRDHLGNVTLQGTSPIGVTLNSNVQAPFTTRVINQTNQNQTLTPDNANATVNGAASYTLASGSAVSLYFDGFLTWIAA